MLQIAKVLKPQGIKGEIKVELFTSDLNFVKQQKTFEIDGCVYNVKSIRIQQKYAYIQTNEILTRNDAELFRNKILCVKKPSNAQQPEDEYYISDLENNRYVPSVKTLSKIAVVLQMDLNFLLEMSEIQDNIGSE